MKSSSKDKVRLARQFAKKKHACMKRKDGKTPYWKHLEKVVSNLKAIGIKEENLLCAGWLHDTIEDTATDFDDIAEIFGTDTARIVSEVTKDNRLPEEKREKEYIRQLKAASPEACLIKFCDIWANIADLPSGYLDDREMKRTKQVNKKLVYFNAIKHGLLLPQKNSNYKQLNLQKGIDRLNKLLAEYGRHIDLSFSS